MTTMHKEWKKGDRIDSDVNGVGLAKSDLIEDGYIKGTASSSKTDLVGHKILAGAFDKSIQRNGLNGVHPGIKLLNHHNMKQAVGNIIKLETVGQELKIEAQMFLDVTWAKDLYLVAKHIGGLNFSVGFELEEFTFVDGDKSVDGEYLVVSQGNLVEVSVVTFPAQPDATMDFIKSHETMADLEKALVAKRFCQSRNDAHKLVTYLKANEHLFLDQLSPSAALKSKTDHPLLDVQLLQACTDLARRANQALR